MTTDLVIVDDDGLSQAEIDLIKQDICKGATNAELALFIRVCNRTHLDPFARQIYSVKRREKAGSGWVERHQTQVSIDGARLVAQRSGEYEGQEDVLWTADGVKWVDVWLENFPPKAARAGVFRSGFRQPLRAVAVWDQYVQTYRRDNKDVVGTMWAKMGSLMIGKCAEMLALRKAFPMELSGLYSAEEMAQAANQDAPAPPTTTRRAAPRRPALTAPETAIVDGEVVGDIGDPIEATSEPATGAQEPSEKDPAQMTTKELTEALKVAGLDVDGTKTQRLLRLVEHRTGVTPVELETNGITRNQLTRVAILFNEKGLADAKHQWMTDLFSRDITSTKELNEEEAESLIKELVSMPVPS